MVAYGFTGKLHITCALQVVKQRMQTGQFTSASNAVRFIASKEGFKGFYAV